jgi:hypothetical protein
MERAEPSRAGTVHKISWHISKDSTGGYQTGMVAAASLTGVEILGLLWISASLAPVRSPTSQKA